MMELSLVTHDKMGHLFFCGTCQGTSSKIELKYNKSMLIECSNNSGSQLQAA